MKGKQNREKDKRYMDTQRLPKKEEEEEEDHLLSSTFESINGHSRDQHNHSIDDFESIFDITIDNLSCSNELTWDFWEEDEDEDVGEEEKRSSTDQEGSSFGFGRISRRIMKTKTWV